MFFDDLESKLASDQTICKSILRDVKCPVHKLKARIIYDYDNDFTYATTHWMKSSQYTGAPS